MSIVVCANCHLPNLDQWTSGELNDVHAQAFKSFFEKHGEHGLTVCEILEQLFGFKANSVISDWNVDSPVQIPNLCIICLSFLYSSYQMRSEFLRRCQQTSIVHDVIVRNTLSQNMDCGKGDVDVLTAVDNLMKLDEEQPLPYGLENDYVEAVVISQNDPIQVHPDVDVSQSLGVGSPKTVADLLSVPASLIDVAVNSVDEPKSTNYICLTCFQSFKWKAHLIVHEQVEHFDVSEGRNKYQCSQCPHVASCKIHLEWHYCSFHTGEKPHCCSELDCSFATVYEQTLKFHMLRSHGDKSFLRQKPAPKKPEDKSSKKTKSRPTEPGHVFKCTEPNCTFQTRSGNSLRRHSLVHIT